MKTAKNQKSALSFFDFWPISLIFSPRIKNVLKIMPLRIAKCVTFLLVKLETSFWCQGTCFGEWESIWNHFQRPQVDLNVKNRM